MGLLKEEAWLSGVSVDWTTEDHPACKIRVLLVPKLLFRNSWTVGM